jgi:predicted phosphodiesterase
MHLRKIDLADEIFVINPGGYTGSSASNEMEYTILDIS